MEILKFIESCNSIEQIRNELSDNYGIKTVQSLKFPELYLFKYTIESPMTEKICQECRSLIINLKTNKIVSHPYHKFFNFGDLRIKSMDWKSTKYYEKLDGSIMILYHYNGEWQVSSSGLPDANGKISTFTDKTYREIFWELWNKLGYQFPSETNHTFMFEMMTKYNRIVCKYDKEQIVFHGVRNNDTMKELDIDLFNYNWQKVKRYSEITDIETALIECDDKQKRPADKYEGFIACDKYFNRMKLKSAEYVRIHRIKSKLISVKSIIKYLNTCGNRETLIKLIPEYKNEIIRIEKQMIDIQNSIMTDFMNYRHISSQKEFALKIKDLPYKSLLFFIRKHDYVDNKKLTKYMIDNIKAKGLS